jgi:GH24 family phage-related lysozyme (muramidase)
MIDALAIRKMLITNEGVRRLSYRDSLGILTIGVGFNLQRPDAYQKLMGLGFNPYDIKQIKLSNISLTDQQIENLLNNDISECLADLRSLVPFFDELPSPAGMVLVDMRFQLGANGLRAFHNTLAAFIAHDWKKAASGLRESLAYKQTTVRWERNALALESLST